MNKFKHTPGPWKVVSFNGNDHIVSSNNDNICQIVLRQNGDHDARLIAAAPDMLEALIDYFIEEGGSDLAKAAVEKATGLTVDGAIKIYEGGAR